MAISMLVLYMTSLVCLLFSRSVHTLDLKTNSTNTEINYEQFERLAKTVNAANSTWTADLESLKTSPQVFASLKLGLSLPPLPKGWAPSLKVGAMGDSDIAAELPEEFDLREQYPRCTNIGHVKIQSNCGSCWAVSSTGALSDRMCIATQGRLNHDLSADHLMTCCPYCTSEGACEGGDPLRGWLYMKKQGVPSGGDYATHQGCKPYRIAPCNLPGYHHCREHKTPSNLKCLGNRCSNPYFRTSYWDNLYFVRSAYEIRAPDSSNISRQEAVMKYEIYTYGSIVAAMTIFEDFLIYKNGVYQHIAGGERGGHAIKVIGWGSEGGVPYWLCVNSWSKYWGREGLVKIRRGQDECSIESMQVSAGVFDEERSSELVDFVYNESYERSSSTILGHKDIATLTLLIWSLLTCLHCLIL